MAYSVFYLVIYTPQSHMSPLLDDGNHGTGKMPIFRNLKTLWSGLVMRQSLLEILGMTRTGNKLESRKRCYNLSRFFWALPFCSWTISVNINKGYSFKHEKQCFIEISKHREESWKYDAQRNILHEIRGVWKADERAVELVILVKSTGI